MQDTAIDMAAPPRGCKAIISPELRTLLQEFQGPEHGLYTMQMTNFYNDSDDERIYHLLHVKDQHYPKLLYNSIEFAVIDLADDAGSRTYRTFQKGQIRSYETYQQIAAETAGEFPGTYVKPLSWYMENRGIFVGRWYESHGERKYQASDRTARPYGNIIRNIHPSRGHYRSSRINSYCVIQG